MHRWHEPSCRRPDVSAASGLPSCHYCFAIALVEEPIASRPFPMLEDRNQMKLSWPSSVSYSDLDSNDAEESQSESESIPGPLFPDLPEESIRLLRLKPGTYDEPLHAEFETVRINQTPLPGYEAVSYTSVSATNSAPCPVYIGNYWDIAYISANCGKALRRFRQGKGERWLWVDALCINQKNADEKNAQVHILREIYSRAIKVLAYVGDEHADFGPAFSFLKDITHSSVKEEDAQMSLSKLFQQPYFFRLWTIQEALMARELEIFCGSLSARWPTRLPKALENILSWLLKDPKWHPFTGHDLFEVLVEASQHQCFDPRDKVFAVLGLMAEKVIRPDYRLPVEGVYVGIATYIIKNCQVMELLGLAGQNQVFGLPSWVPDWSQSLSLSSMDTFMRKGQKSKPNNLHRNGTLRIKFGCFGSPHDVQVSSATGTMRLRGLKLCRVSGAKSHFRDYTQVEMQCSSRGSFIISIPRQTYEVQDSDYLLLLPGYKYPVILREVHKDTYKIISPCVVSIGSPSRKHLVAWYRRPGQLGSALGLDVSALAPEEDRSLQDLYSRLIPNPEPEQNHTVTRTRILSFLMLPHEALRSIESTLKQDWSRYNRDLGWMFTDQSALWMLLHELTQMPIDERIGEDTLTVRGPSVIGAFPDQEIFSERYTWDLVQFCWAFLQPTDSVPDPARELPAVQWSPMVDRLRSRIGDIRDWAKTTEKLLKVFEYTDTALGDTWDSLSLSPGSQIVEKWTSRYRDFLSGPALGFGLGIQGQQDVEGEKTRPHLTTDHTWNSSEFETQLHARERIWDLAVHEGSFLRTNVRAHALLYYLGLDLCSEVHVDII